MWKITYSVSVNTNFSMNNRGFNVQKLIPKIINRFSNTHYSVFTHKKKNKKEKTLTTNDKTYFTGSILRIYAKQFHFLGNFFEQ
jgi:hypothetical protein